MSATELPFQVVDTEELSIGYEVRGPIGGHPVLLLHGWPDGVRTWNSVAGTLADAGYRTIAPYLRGFGPTRFLRESTPRVAQPTALACDIVQFMDALDIKRATVVGHDWGGRLGYTLGALWPERVERLVAVSVSYETGVPAGSQLNYHQQQAYWYQWFFASERGREALLNKRRELCEYLWRTWSPTWQFSDAEFATTAAAWDNPDWVEITLHSYRVRWGNASIDPRYAPWEERLNKHPLIEVPTVHLHGAADGCSLPESAEDQSASFTAGYSRSFVPGAGHFVPRERPDAITAVLLGKSPGAI